MLTSRVTITMLSGKSSMFGLSDLLRDLSHSVTDRIWNYFSPAEDDADDQETPYQQEVRDALSSIYGNTSVVALQQAQSILQGRYHGDMAAFMTEFFYPTVNMLRKLKRLEQKQLADRSTESRCCECDGTVTLTSLLTADNSPSQPGGKDTPSSSCEHLCLEEKHGCNSALSYHDNTDLSADHLYSDYESAILKHNYSTWPTAVPSGIIVNLSESDRGFDGQNGDLYFYVGPSSSNEIGLWVKLFNGSESLDTLIPENKFGSVFTMDIKEQILPDSTDRLVSALQVCLTTLEQSVERLRWEDIIPNMDHLQQPEAKFQPPQPACSHLAALSTTGANRTGKQPSYCAKCNSANSASKYNNVTHRINHHGLTSNRHAHSQPQGLSTPYKLELGSRPGMDAATDGRESDKPPTPRSPGLHKHRYLDPPRTILDVDYRLLQSGVAILPGSHDLDQNAVVLLFTSSSLWKNQQVTSTDLARLLMYYFSVPRETIRCRGLTIVADIRGCSTSTINTLLESLYLFEGNVPQAIAVVHLLADKHTQSLVLKSPIYDVHAAFQIDLLLSSELLFSYISPDQLPPVLDGSYQYNHEDWVRFHMRLDPFVTSCKAVVKFLVTVIEELSVIDQVPASAEEASHLVNHHETLIKSTFEDPRVLRLQNEGDSILKSLEREEVNIGHSDNYRYAMEDVTRLYGHVKDTMRRLMGASDNRLHRLDKCLQLKAFDEECNKVITWLQHQGNECLQRHLLLADNLKSVRLQQRDFEKFYYAANAQIEKGNDILEQASTLAQCGDFDEVIGCRELARMLKRHLQDFSERLEERRERIERASKCYQLLDKTYEWALEAMKYVASMKMEHCATIEGVEKLLRSLDMYLHDHPPMSEQTFTLMTDMAKQLDSERLLEQCETAQNRCIETQKMLTLRGNTLQQFYEQLEQEQSVSSNKNASSSDFRMPMSPLRQASGLNSALSSAERTSQPHWEPKDTSTPVSSKFCSRNQSKVSRDVLHTVPSSCSSPISLSSPSHSLISTSTSSSSSSPHHTCQPSHLSVSTNTSPEHLISQPQSVDRAQTKFQEHRTDLDYGATCNENWNIYVTTALPKHLVDRRANLSKENMAEQRLISNPDLNITPTGPSQGQSSNPSQQMRPKTKQFKRAITSPHITMGPPIVEEDLSGETKSSRVKNLRNEGRTDSMITGSSDSIPSLHDESEAALPANPDYVHREWAPVPVNSHLTEQLCNMPVQPDNDLKLTEQEFKSRRTLSLIMSEMIQTERDYVCSLRLIVENYIPEMLREDMPQILRGKRNVIFGNIEKIYQFHQQYFLQEMEASKRNPFLIAKYFLMHENQFHLYALYNKNKPKSDALMAEYGKLFFRSKQFELGDKMDLSSYLLKPVQRMGKYALMIKQVLKECPSSALEYNNLKAAEEMVRFQLRHGNDLLAVDSLKECDVNIQEQGRLLRQDEFLVFQGRRKYMRHVFLFEDLILFSKTQRSRSGGQDTYLYKFSFKMSDIGVTQDYDGSNYKFEIWWRRRSSGDRYVLQAANSDLKKCWVRDVTRLLWNQAMKNRENRLSEMATMGIGNKPCLDIKPSSNNINDRFINYAIGNKEARTRNSIAVCSSDHLREGNKRPHSIISVSSNSSSNSSHSGHLSFGAMNLAFNPVDSPHAYRRSFMSTESGIGTSIVSGADMDGDATRMNSPPPSYMEATRHQTSTSLTQHGLDRDCVRHRIMNLPSHSEEVTDV